MEIKDYIAQWVEVKKMTIGKTMEEVHALFGNEVTNYRRDELLDANYKDILVSFGEKDGKANLHTTIEMYNENDIFIGCLDVAKESENEKNWPDGVNPMAHAQWLEEDREERIKAFQNLCTALYELERLYEVPSESDHPLEMAYDIIYNFGEKENILD